MEYTVKIRFDGLSELMEHFRKDRMEYYENELKEPYNGIIERHYMQCLKEFKEATTEKLLEEFLFYQLCCYEIDKEKTATQNE